MAKTSRFTVFVAVGLACLVSFATGLRGNELTLPGLGAASAATSKSSAPKINVSLLADRTGMVPGGTVDLAVQFELPDEWHIYWSNPGEGGLETRLDWKLPKGYTISPARFPQPAREVDEMDAHTFILEGSPAILATLAAPKEAVPGEKARIEVEASWLACKKLCFPGRRTLVLELPIVSTADQAQPVHEDEFDAAREGLPISADKARFIKGLHAVANVDKIKPGEKFMLGVVFEVEDGYHVNSHQPLDAYLIPTDIFAELTEGVEFERSIFPPGAKETHQGQRLSVYRGRTVLTLPARADGDLSQEELRFAGVLTYQACNDKTGTCYPPIATQWLLVVPVAQAGEATAQVNQDLFRAPVGQSPGNPSEAQSGAASGGFTLESQIDTTFVQEQHSLGVWLFFALLAGLILNVTPCVLPVISIKVLSFVQQAQSPARVFRMGLAFSLGMMIVFNILAVMATALGLVWGQHFQSPAFTIGMAAVVFAFGLSMFGVFTLGVPQVFGDMAAKTEGEGYVGSIAKGALATVMGTPCLGPFLGPVLVWASGQPSIIVFLIFNTIGVGMALPYIVLTAHPAWLRFVPKAGPWLTTFKQSMAFLLMGAVVYLLYILDGQLGGAAVIRALIFLLAVGLACWMIGRFITFNTPPGKRVMWFGAVSAVVAITGFGSFGDVNWQAATTASAPEVVAAQEVTVIKSRAEHVSWVPFSMETLTELTAQGKPVLLDITARWCPNCQYNTAFVFDTPEVAEAIAKYGAIPMLADWTARDKVTGDLVEKLAPGASIPLAAVFPAGRPNEPIVMLGIVTKQQVIDSLAKASATQP